MQAALAWALIGCDTARSALCSVSDKTLFSSVTTVRTDPSRVVSRFAPALSLPRRYELQSSQVTPLLDLVLGRTPPLSSHAIFPDGKTSRDDRNTAPAVKIPLSPRFWFVFCVRAPSESVQTWQVPPVPRSARKSPTLHAVPVRALLLGRRPEDSMGRARARVQAHRALQGTEQAGTHTPARR